MLPPVPKGVEVDGDDKERNEPSPDLRATLCSISRKSWASAASSSAGDAYSALVTASKKNEKGNAGARGVGRRENEKSFSGCGQKVRQKGTSVGGMQAYKSHKRKM